MAASPAPIRPGQSTTARSIIRPSQPSGSTGRNTRAAVQQPRRKTAKRRRQDTSSPESPDAVRDAGPSATIVDTEDAVLVSQLPALPSSASGSGPNAAADGEEVEQLSRAEHLRQVIKFKSLMHRYVPDMALRGGNADDDDAEASSEMHPPHHHPFASLAKTIHLYVYNFYLERGLLGLAPASSLRLQGGGAAAAGKDKHGGPSRGVEVIAKGQWAKTVWGRLEAEAESGIRQREREREAGKEGGEHSDTEKDSESASSEHEGSDADTDGNDDVSTTSATAKRKRPSLQRQRSSRTISMKDAFDEGAMLAMCAYVESLVEGFTEATRTSV